MGESLCHLAVFLRQVQQRVQLFSKIVVQPGYYYLAEIGFKFINGVRRLGAYQAVDEQHGLCHLNVEDAVGPEPNEPKLLVPECYRIPGAPLEIGEYLKVDKIYLGPYGAGESPWQGKQFREKGNVKSRDGMPARAKCVAGNPLGVENRCLVIPDYGLGPELEFSRSPFREPVRQLLS